MRTHSVGRFVWRVGVDIQTDIKSICLRYVYAAIMVCLIAELNHNFLTVIWQINGNSTRNEISPDLVRVQIKRLFPVPHTVVVTSIFRAAIGDLVRGFMVPIYTGFLIQAHTLYRPDPIRT